MKNYMLGLYEKSMPKELSFKEKLKITKDTGFDFLEMSIDASDEKLARLSMTKDERKALVDDMFNNDCFIRSMCVSALTKYSLGNDKKEYADKGMEILKKAIMLAYDLGIRIVMFSGYDVYYEESTEETKNRFLTNLKEIAPFAEMYSVTLGMETMENHFMNNIEKAMKYVRLVGSNYIKIYPDSGNITNASKLYKTSIKDDIELGSGNICAFHLKESNPGIFREVPYGTGHVDFKTIISTALNENVHRFTAEFWYKGSDNWMDDIKKNREFFNQFF